MVVTFFGHRHTSEKIKPILKSVLQDLIENNNADMFYVGNQGSFDWIVRKALTELKQLYPHIRYNVVLAYMPINKTDNDYMDFTDTIYPDGLEKTPPRYAIHKRNCWMLERADTVITNVIYKTGGAAQFENLAIKKGKCVINLNNKI